MTELGASLTPLTLAAQQELPVRKSEVGTSALGERMPHGRLQPLTRLLWHAAPAPRPVEPGLLPGLGRPVATLPRWTL